MKYFDWDKKKNEKIKVERNISFDEVLLAIEKKDVLVITKHPNEKKYPNQRMYIVKINDYAYMVPFVEDEEKVFLKTIIPSRKATKHYLYERRNKK